MTRVSVTDGKLAIEVQGWDKFWSMTSRLEIPLEHVVDIRPGDDEFGGVRVLGTYVPGVITAGKFLQEGRWVFWNVHDPAKAIAVDLRDEHYSKLIIEVADPAETISTLHHAIARALLWIRLAWLGDAANGQQNRPLLTLAPLDEGRAKQVSLPNGFAGCLRDL